MRFYSVGVRWASKGALIISLFVLILAAAGPAWSQAETGQINGTVTDPSGAVVPNATVTITNLATGAVRIVNTNAQGFFSAPNLLPASYSVVLNVSGFKKAEQDVTVTVGGTVGVNLKLAIASAAGQTVEITSGGVAQVNTETPTVGTFIDSKEILQLPTLTRNPYDFAALSGTVSEDDPSGRGVMGLSINGQRAAGTNVLLDGSANNDEFTASVGQPVPLDSVQEFSILTNNYGAQYGRADAGVVNVATRSGTNEFHGSGYEFNRVSRLASNDFFNNANGISRSTYVRNQFGFSIGGPIKRNKLFFFANPEWNRIRSNGSQVVLIPDPAFLSAAAANTQAFFTALGKPRSSLTSLGAFSRQDFINAGSPDPCTGSASGGPCQSYPLTSPMFDKVQYTTPSNAGAGSPTNQYLLDSRVDWDISDKSQLYVRFADNHAADFAGSVNTSPYQGYETGQLTSDQNALISFTRVVSLNLVSQSKIVYNRLSNLQPLGANPVGPTLYLENTTGTQFGGTLVALPGYSEFTPGNAIPFGGPQNFYQAYEDLSFTHGVHTIRFGGSYTYLEDNRAFGAYEEAIEGLSSSNPGLGLDNFLNGQLALFESAIYPQGKTPCVNVATPTSNCTVTLPVGPPQFTRSNRYNELGAYVSDEWKVRPTLELTLGLRWDYYGVQHNSNPNLDSNYYLGGGGNFFEQYANGDVSIASQSSVGGLWAPDFRDFSPHLGFAWDVFGDGKTSLRGGYSIGYERNFGNVTFNLIQNPPNYAVVSLRAGTSGVQPGPITTNNAGPLSGTTGTIGLPTTSLRNVNPHIRTAYAHLYSLTLEHQFSPHLLGSIGYSGSKGARLYSLTDFNSPGTGNVYLGLPCNNGGVTPSPAAPCTTRLRSTQYSTAFRRNSDGKSLYNSLNVGLTMNNLGTTGLSLSANYTYAKAIDDLSSTFSEGNFTFNTGYLDPYNPNLDRGPAEFDNRHRIALGAIWNIPFARGTEGVEKQVLDGWEIAPIFVARTGFPVSIFDCTNAFQTCPRAFAIGPGIPTTGHAVPTGVPDVNNYINFGTAGTNYDSSYFNPITGTSDFGPFPSNMTGRNTFRGPGNYNLDLGMYKNFKVTERYNLQFRGEMYNTLNHANMSLIPFSNGIPFNSAIQSQRTGNRNVQLAVRFTF